MPSIVYLIGAGPGDPRLITVRGLQCLASADVVVYDHLVHARLLRHARQGAETIDVGLTAPQTIEQDAISFLLAEKAREGKVVARLKWGDPFVFGRGGAEALFLHEQGVPFEVVPGVPVELGAASYAGVPLSYPGGGDTLTFVRVHDADGKARETFDWTSLARLDGTLVCHGGPEQLAHMLGSLLGHGRPKDDSAAVVYGATLPTQQTRVGTLEELARMLKQSEDARAGTLVVGRVAALRDHLRWFDARPLFGRRILVTRSREQAAELVEPLEALGAEAIESPLIRIVPPEDYGPLDEACAKINRFDWVIFSSANAVEAFIERLLGSPLDLRALGGVKLCAVGPATAKALARHGLKVDFVPNEFRADAVAHAFSSFGNLSGLRVFLPRADIGREIVADELRKQGVVVTEAVAYRTVPADPEREGEPDIYRMLLERRIDVVTFTSASAVRNFVTTLGAEPAVDLLRTTRIASIGPVTAEAAAQFGVHTTIMPTQHTVAALVEAIVEHLLRHP